MELNAEQRRAAEHSGGHVLVLAGAGTGKTRTIIARAAHLIRNGVEPSRILLMTFTRRAAREMTHRLEQDMGQQAKGVVAGTFHHFCLRTMRQMAKPFGVEGATVIDRDDQIELMKLARANFVEKGKQFPKASQLVKLCSFARNTNQTLANYLEKYTEHDEQVSAEIIQVFREYEKRKRTNGYLDYDDILHRFARRLREDGKIRQRLRRLYDHILVDEMQDTNPLQWLILDGLRDPAQLFCVGDDAQSIYAFRGADFRNVHSFSERVPGSTVLRLEENYRSRQPILDLANWLLATSPLEYDKHLRATRGAGSLPLLLDFDSDLDEAQWVAQDLLERRETGSDWSEHMILTRSAFGARAVEAALVEHEIPYRFIGGTQLLQAAHVKDLLALVRAAASPSDELAWSRYLTLFKGIGDVTAARLIEELRDCADTETALQVVRDRQPSRPELIKGIEEVLSHWDQPPEALEAGSEFLEPVIQDNYNRWEARKRDFQLLQRLSQRFKDLMRFIDTYTLDPVSVTEASRSANDDVVTLITVHSAKGTEAEVCYLIRVEPNMYPHFNSLGDKDREEEERRVLYVAMTRPKDELILTRSMRYRGDLRFYSGTRGAHRSGGTVYFFDEVPEELVSGGVVPAYDPLGEDEIIQPWDR